MENIISNIAIYFDVIIIGGGLSGLIAAYEIQKINFSYNIKIFEA